MNKNQVLKQRTLTGIVFGVVVLALLLSGKTGAIILLAAIAGLAGYEYIRMVYPKDITKSVLVLILIYVIIGVLVNVERTTTLFLYVVILSCFGFLFGIINLFSSFINHSKFFWLVSIFYFGLPLGLIISYIYQYAIYPEFLCISLISLIWINDSFAYLVGSRIGKTKLFDRISPKKTWEGFIGGGVFTVAGAFIISLYYTDFSTIFWLSSALVVWVIGTMGDLVESSIKRTFGVKDSGNLLPGHGGILDRFDSFIYILPFILFLLLQFSK